MEGYIKLSRSFFENEIWQAARAYSDCEAWLDLIQSARFEASPITSRIGSLEVTWGRGQYPASVRFLAKKWGRSEQWVRTLLGKLKRKNMITTDNSKGVNVITLVNYEKYNGSTSENTANNTANNTPNSLSDSDMQRLATHLVTQLSTHLPKNQHTPNTNNKKEEYIYSLSKDNARENLEISLAECYNTLSENQSWKEIIVMNTRIGGFPTFSEDDFRNYLDLFFRKLQNEGVATKSVSDGMSHFSRWLKIELQNGNKETRRNYTSKQEANDYAMQQFLAYYQDAHSGVSGGSEGE